MSRAPLPKLLSWAPLALCAWVFGVVALPLIHSWDHTLDHTHGPHGHEHGHGEREHAHGPTSHTHGCDELAHLGPEPDYDALSLECLLELVEPEPLEHVAHAPGEPDPHHGDGSLAHGDPALLMTAVVLPPTLPIFAPAFIQTPVMEGPRPLARTGGPIRAPPHVAHHRSS